VQFGWIILGGVLLVVLAAWWIILWRHGVRTPPSGNDPDDFNRNNIN